MANGYQAQHSRQRGGHPGRRGAAAAVTALIVVVAAWVAASHGSDQANTAQSDRASQRVFASNGTTTIEPTTSPTSPASPPSSDTTIAAGTTTSVAPPSWTPATAGGQSLRTTRQPSTPAQTTRATGATATTQATVPAPPKGVYIPPTATWTTFSCVAHGSGTSGETAVTYTVTFSGGKGWTALGGGTTGTEVQTFPGSGSSKAPIVITTAHVRDTVNNVTRTVGLSNARPIQC